MTAKWVPPDADDLVKRYVAGESEKALAETFGVSRTAIRRALLDAGVQPRNRSESMYARMAQTSPEERARLASAAHEAARGRRISADEKAARARGIEAMGADAPNASPAERVLAGWLSDAGLTVIHQKAIGPYNVDLAAGSVAVEVLGGGWHRVKLHGERLRYILDAGWDVVYVWVAARDYPLGPGAAQYVVTHCEFRDGNPAAPRCYRVIRGCGQFVAGGSADGDDIPDILPVGDHPDVRPAEVPYGFCHCGCGRKTSIVREADPRNGYARGEPRRFIRGHGHKVRGGNAS